MHHHTAIALALAAALCTPLAQAQPTGRLNDTGQALCYDGATMVACTSASAVCPATSCASYYTIFRLSPA